MKSALCVCVVERYFIHLNEERRQGIQRVMNIHVVYLRVADAGYFSHGGSALFVTN